MRIAHIAPFAPARCGLYESARDFVRADSLQANDAWMVDRGVYVDGVLHPASVNPVDGRGGWSVPIRPPESLADADVIVEHVEPAPEWREYMDAPEVWMLHGRPTACFRPEQRDPAANHYTKLLEIVARKNVKAAVTMWPEHVPYWEWLLPRDKLHQLPAPPICGEKFSDQGELESFGEATGKQNVVIAASWREDVDIFELTNGVIQYAIDHPGQARFHFFGVRTLPNGILLPVWEPLIAALRRADSLGLVNLRHTDMAKVYRAADLVLSPHRICTRVIGEALQCGTPVLAAVGCAFAQWTAPIDDPSYTAREIAQALDNLADPIDAMHIMDDLEFAREMLSLDTAGQAMNKIYEQATGG